MAPLNTAPAKPSFRATQADFLFSIPLLRGWTARAERSLAGCPPRLAFKRVFMRTPCGPVPPNGPFCLVFFDAGATSVLCRYNLFPLRGLSYRYGGSVAPFSSQESDLQTRTRDPGTFMNPLLGDSRSARPLRPPPLRSVLAWLLASALFFAPCLDAAYDAYPAALPAKDRKQKQDPVLKGLPVTDLTPDEAVFHALNRLAYCPRPGDVERIKQIALAKSIHQQPNAKSITDKPSQSPLHSSPTLHPIP